MVIIILFSMKEIRNKQTLILWIILHIRNISVDF